MRLGVLSMVLMPAAGCGLIASDGPSANNVLGGAAVRRKPDAASMEQFALLGVDNKIVSSVEQFYRPPVVAVPREFQQDQKFGVLGVGDLLHVTIWEAATPGTGLFAQAGRNGGELNIRVDADGTVAIPYGGRIRASGTTVAALEKTIEASISDKAVDPRVTVLVAEPISGSVSVQGEVTKTGPVALVKPGERLLDVLALAGGTKFPPYEINVRVTRGRSSFAIDLQSVIDQPEMYNVKVGGGDSVLFTRAARKFIALGAVLVPGDQVFRKASLSLSDALGQMVGMESQRADAKALFLFRREPAALAAQLGVNLPSDGGKGVPIVYQVDMKDPRSFFVLGSFPVRPNDILFVSTAPLAEFAKFMQILSGATGAVAIPRTLFSNYPAASP